MKLGLGSVSMIFDILFMIQHFILYPNHEEPAEDKLITEEVESLDLETRDFAQIEEIKRALTAAGFKLS